MPDPQRVIAAVRRAADLSLATSGRLGNVVALDDADDVLVVGDLHGNLRAFRAFLDRADLARHPRRHLVLQELIHDTHSDPDDGVPDLSHRLVALAAALKAQHPDRVHYLLGNHELAELTGRPIAKKGIPLNRPFFEGIALDYGDAAAAVHAAYLRLFAALPLAARTPNRVFLVHTLPEARQLDDFDPGVFAAAGWTDAQCRRGGPVYAVTWGRDVTPATADRFAAIMDTDLFICGHQPCDAGFLVANARLLIIDGTDPYPAACHFRASGPVAIDDLRAGVVLLPPVA